MAASTITYNELPGTKRGPCRPGWPRALNDALLAEARRLGYRLSNSFRHEFHCPAPRHDPLLFIPGWPTIFIRPRMDPNTYIESTCRLDPTRCGNIISSNEVGSVLVGLLQSWYVEFRSESRSEVTRRRFPPRDARTIITSSTRINRLAINYRHTATEGRVQLTTRSANRCTLRHVYTNRKPTPHQSRNMYTLAFLQSRVRGWELCYLVRYYIVVPSDRPRSIRPMQVHVYVCPSGRPSVRLRSVTINYWLEAIILYRMYVRKRICQRSIVTIEDTVDSSRAEPSRSLAAWLARKQDGEQPQLYVNAYVYVDTCKRTNYSEHCVRVADTRQVS